MVDLPDRELMNVVAVWPAAEARRRERLLGTVGRFTDAQFVGVDTPAVSPEDARALIVFSSTGGEFPDGASSALPTLVLEGQPGESHMASIAFADTKLVDPSLRGQVVSSSWSASTSERAGEFDVLARAGSEPVWRRARTEQWSELVCADLVELAAGEQLSQRFRSGDCLGTIALIQFVRAAVGSEWLSPAPRACIVIDDPNTRRPTYGHIDYSELVRHADEFDYHVTFAQIPLDLSVFDAATVALFRSHPGRLSLALHGNNHTHNELVAPRTAEEADRILAQALHRAARFKGRTGVEVARIMVPPHGECSELVLTEMAKLQFESVTLARPRVSWDPLAGLEPAEVSESGMPVLIRRKIVQHDHAIIRAFLGQPIVLYGHEADFDDGLGFLESAANVVNRIPGASWHDIASLSRANFCSRRRGHELELRPYARRLHVAAGPDVRVILIDPLVGDGDGREVELRGHDGAQVVVPDSSRSRVVLNESDTETRIEIQFESEGSVDPDLISEPRFRPAPFVRRLATEARDRSHPLRKKFLPGS